jgi:hypothetical protein
VEALGLPQACEAHSAIRKWNEVAAFIPSVRWSASSIISLATSISVTGDVSVHAGLLVAPRAVPAAEPICCGRFPEVHHQKDEILTRSRVERTLQRSNNRHRNRCWLPVPTLWAAMSMCWQPSNTTSERRTPVYARSASARRALVPRRHRPLRSHCDLGWRCGAARKPARHIAPDASLRRTGPERDLENPEPRPAGQHHNTGQQSAALKCFARITRSHDHTLARA